MNDPRTHINKTMQLPSVNAGAYDLVRQLIDDADALRIGVQHYAGCTLIDAGVNVAGGLEAGRRIAEICMGGLGTVRMTHGSIFGNWPAMIETRSSHPVLACLASQYAGWSLSHGEGKSAFFALGSGPARALALKEPLYEELGYRDRAEQACLVLEVDSAPPPELVEKVAAACKLDASQLTLIVTPTRSLAGGFQVVARVLEVALHKAHELGFPLASIVDGTGRAPVCPPAPDFITAMGRTNDAILFGGEVHLFVDGADDDARQLAQQLPSSASRDYGRPFAEIFSAYDHDFFQIDPMLFSPARVHVTALSSGCTYHAGRLDQELLERSFGGAL